VWVSPNHPNPPRQPGPPPDDGRELVTIRRRDGHELRVRLKTYESHPYVLIQLWKLDAHGAAWPVKGRSTSIRMGEIGDVIDALQLALLDSLAVVDRGQSGTDGQGGNADLPLFVDKGRPVRDDWRSRQLPRGDATANFDEFEVN
jgi:hypothetical protein